MTVTVQVVFLWVDMEWFILWAKGSRRNCADECQFFVNQFVLN